MRRGPGDHRPRRVLVAPGRGPGPPGAWLVVADDGPGFGEADPTRRGQSSGGSTGLGLDIARRIAEASGGTMILGRSTSGGGSVTLGLGSPVGPPEEGRRHRRSRFRLRTGTGSR
ncbi:MAG: ATP-binding protein [Streptosporangiaceae bacterium]